MPYSGEGGASARNAPPPPSPFPYATGKEAQSVFSRLASLLSISQAIPKPKMLSKIGCGLPNVFLMQDIVSALGRCIPKHKDEMNAADEWRDNG